MYVCTYIYAHIHVCIYVHFLNWDDLESEASLVPESREVLKQSLRNSSQKKPKETWQLNVMYFPAWALVPEKGIR